MTNAEIEAEIEAALNAGWIYTYRRHCVSHQMTALRPLISRLLGGTYSRPDDTPESVYSGRTVP